MRCQSRGVERPLYVSYFAARLGRRDPWTGSLIIRSIGSAKKSARSLALSEYSAIRACGKTPLLRHHRRPLQRAAGKGVTKCTAR